MKKYNLTKKIAASSSAVLLAGCLAFTSHPLTAYAALNTPAVGQSLTKSTGLNIRQSSSTSSKVLSQLNPGAYIEIIGESGDFYQVKYNSDGAIGYCHKDYIKIISDRSGSVATKSGTLNLRKQATTSSSVLTALVRGTDLPVLSVLDNGWLKVVSGKTVGYVYGDYFILEDDSEPEATEDTLRTAMVELAKSYEGTLYEWGGDIVSNPYSYGFDCSHFTYQVMKAFGLIDTYRTSSSQYSWCTKITRDELQPGDLVFYKNSSGRINHVTMYIGNGMIIGANGGDSSTTTAAAAKSRNAKVKIQSIDYRSSEKVYGRAPGLN